MKRALLIGVLLACATSAQAKPLFVSTSGSDAVTYAENDAAHPWATIGRAAWGSGSRSAPNPSEAAKAGDVVQVSAGTYATPGTGGRFAVALSPANSGTALAPIVFRASGVVTLTLSSGRGPVIGSERRDYVTWDGFTIDESAAPAAQDTGPVVVFGATGVVLTRLDLRGVQAPWQDNHNGIRIEQSNGTRVTQSVIRGVGSATSYGQNDAAIMLYDSNDTVIEHNDLLDSGVGVFVKGQHPGFTQRRTIIRWNRIHGMRAQGLTIGPAARDGRTYQNVISGCAQTAPAIRLYDFGAGEGVEPVGELVAHNTITGCGGLYVMGVGQGVAVRGNVFDATGVTSGLYPVTALPASVAGLTFDGNVYIGAGAATLDADGSGRRVSVADWRTTVDAGASGALPGSVVDALDLDGDGSTTDTIPAGAVVTGREVIGRGTVSDPPPPSPVDCEGTWGAWTPMSASACRADGSSTVTEGRLFTVTTLPAHGGRACPASPETRERVEPCTPTTTLTVAATGRTRTCTLEASTNAPPDGRRGWGVLFSRRRVGESAWAAHGTRDADGSDGYARSAQVGLGAWEVAAQWTRSGEAAVPVPGVASWVCR